MASLQQVPRLLLRRIHRAPTPIRPYRPRRPYNERVLSTTAFTKPSATPKRTSAPSRSRDVPNKPSRTARPSPSSTVRTAPSGPSVSGQTSSPERPVAPGPSQDAIRAAMLREQALRIARLQRAGHREEEILGAQKKKLAQLDYTSRYNSAARKWVSSIIALPILLVTSYYLFDRREFCPTLDPEFTTNSSVMGSGSGKCSEGFT
ncbi:hypothetical protein QQX98_004977 [Neonectria punicea]|uniref:Uncharacterized protein n=1 Tax=Neonectria punicea TaxID=979145 RepID=A0ABR1H6N4_9HYPO